jgi:hypothetical protein
MDASKFLLCFGMTSNSYREPWKEDDGAVVRAFVCHYCIKVKDAE